jgi:MFS family permease
VAVLWFAFALNYLDRQMIFSMFPLLRRDLGLTDTQLGLVGTVFLWVYSLSMPLAGRLADRFRADRLIVVSILLWSLATLGTGFSRSIGELLAWRAAMGISEALYIPAAVGLIAHLHTNATRSKALAFHQSAQYLGTVAGGWYGGWAADNLGLQTGFLAVAVIGFGYAVLVRWVLPRRDAAMGKSVVADSAGRAGIITPPYVALAAAFLVLCIMLWMFYAWLPTLLYERFGLSMTESGLMAAGYLQVSAAAGVLTGGVAGDWCARNNPAARLMLAAGGLIATAPFAFLSLSQPALGATKFAVAGFGVASGIMVANVFSAIYDLAPKQHYSFAVGLINMLGGISGGAAILLAGYSKAAFGIDFLMRSAAWCAAVAGLTLAWIGWRQLRQIVSEKGILR